VTAYSIDKNFAANKVVLDPERTINGWLAKNRAYIPGTNPAIDLTGLVRWRLNKQYAVPAPVTGLVRMPGGLKSGVDPTTLFTEFAHYSAAATVDPNVAIVKAKTSGAAYDAASTGNFRRVSMSLTLPNDTNSQRRAAYIAPGIRVVGMTQNNGVNLDAVQVEVAQAGATTPTTYSPARALQVGVRPNRLNYASNPSWRSTSGTTVVRTNLGWHKSTTGFTASNPTGASWTPSVVGSGGPEDGGAFYRQTLTGTATAIGGGVTFGAITANTIPVTAGQAYFARALLRSSSDKTIYMLIRYYDAANAQVGGSTQASPAILAPANQWTEYTVPVGTAPTGATHAYVTWFQTAGSFFAAGDTVDVAGLLIENASKNLGWFDGATAATPDGLTYSWSGTAGASASRASGPIFTTAPFTAYTGCVSWQSSPGVMRVLAPNGPVSSLWGFNNLAPGLVTADVGSYWGMRFKVRQVGGSQAVSIIPRLGWYSQAGANLGVTGVVDSVTSLAPDGAWVEIVGGPRLPAPSGVATVRPLVYSTGTTPAGTVLEFKECIIERLPSGASTPGTYFDGSSGADYLWEAGTSADTSRSYYYEDYAVRQYLLKQVLAENCPLGVIPAVPQFAVQPRF
jgi:hypothetical protein